ncbi:MAG: hypothetical protein GX102_04605 [Porphyromonadaceae bacterium]|nr:hypothetical protein [Porphyromonadaceae bacterium]
MTKKDVEVHMKQLLKEKKVYMDYRDAYTYSFAGEAGTGLLLNFIPKYYNGELYKMIYPINTNLNA